jgi:hypothetical protein
MHTHSATRVASLLMTILLACGGSSSSPSGPKLKPASAVLVPAAAWTCGMPDGIPNPADGELLFRATLQLGDTLNLGATPYGNRRVLDIAGGEVTGDKLQATVLAGGFDFELTLSNGVVEQEQIGVLRAGTAVIYMRTCGVAPAGANAVWFVPDFEVASANTALGWLNTGTFAGIRTIDTTANTMELAVYDVSKLTTAANRTQIAKPEGVPSQPWECAPLSGTKGDVVYTENVPLGASLSVGASKRGTRNIVPITGGTVTGNPDKYPTLSGTIVAGGADYQLTPPHADMILDARYVLALGDPAQYVIVRNCGTWSKLVPVFEAPVSGPYAFFNTGSFLSSQPDTSKPNSVGITIYERN